MMGPFLQARRRLAEARRQRLLMSRTARDVTPPPPSAFGSFGAQSWVVPPARVTAPELIHIGERVVIQEHAWISVVAAVDGVQPRLTIGDGTQIARMSHIACVGEVEIGNEVLIAERVLIGDTFHGYEDPDVPIIDQPMVPPEKVMIGDGAYIGQGAIILMGVTVGANAYVAAGAVVTADVAPRTVVVGNPARAVRGYDTDTNAWHRISG